MSTGVFSPAAIEKSKYILLQEGIVYGNYGTDNYEIGCTRGGSKFTLDRVIKEINYDGAYGPVKTMRRCTQCTGKLDINFLKLTYTNLAYGLNMDVSDGTDKDGTYKSYDFRLNWEDTDVLTNIAFKGQKQDGTVCIIIINNALNVGNISLAFTEKDEVIAPMTYQGFYSYSTPTTVPVEIWDYIAA